MLTGKVIIITGGCGLLGREFTRAIARQNGTAIIADIDEAQAQKLREQFKAEGLDATDFCKMDITSKESLKQAIALVASRYGRIDGLVNNAYPRNRNYGRRFEGVTYEDFCENISLHLGGYFLVSQQIAEFFREQGHGCIVNIASIYGVIAPRFDIYENTEMTMPVEYAVIKSGLIHLTKYMARYFANCNIRVNSISPGGIFDAHADDFVARYSKYCTEESGMLKQSDVAGTLVFLLSDLARPINGQNLVVDKGFIL